MYWNLARERHVEYVIVHSFNQWVGPGEELDQERSTDIEPMQGGHGDYYLRLLKEEVNMYKYGQYLTQGLNASNHLEINEEFTFISLIFLGGQQHLIPM